MSANMKKMMDKIAGYENYWLSMEKENLVDLPPLHNKKHLEIISSQYRFDVNLLKFTESVNKTYYIEKYIKWTNNEKEALQNMGYSHHKDNTYFKSMSIDI